MTDVDTQPIDVTTQFNAKQITQERLKRIHETLGRIRISLVADFGSANQRVDLHLLDAKTETVVNYRGVERKRTFSLNFENYETLDDVVEKSLEYMIELENGVFNTATGKSYSVSVSDSPPSTDAVKENGEDVQEFVISELAPEN